MAGLEKTLMLQEVKKKIQDKQNIFLTKVNKVAVDDFNQLRQSLDAVAENSFVVKNSIARIAFKDLGLDAGTPVLDGTMLLVVANDEPQKVSKELVAFGKAKEKEQFSIEGAFIEGDFSTGDSYVKELALLPSKELVVAKLLGTMQAPITNFVFGLNGLIRSLAIALNEISKKKSEQ